MKLLNPIHDFVEVFWPLIDKCLDTTLQNNVKVLVIVDVPSIILYLLPISKILAVKSLRESMIQSVSHYLVVWQIEIHLRKLSCWDEQAIKNNITQEEEEVSEVNQINIHN